MPPIAPSSSIPLSEISDFALGHLPARASLEMLDRIENDPQASADLDFLVELMNFAKRNPSLERSDATTL